MASAKRFFRHTAVSVMQLYLEFEDGVMPGGVFDPRILDYRIDIERILEQELSAAELTVLMAVHRDGKTDAEAVAMAGLDTQRPSALVRRIEIRIGKVFERKNFLDFTRYLS